MRLMKINKKSGGSFNIDIQVDNKIVFGHGGFGVFLTNTHFIGQGIIMHNVTIGASMTHPSKKRTVFEGPFFIGAGAFIVGDNDIKIGNNVIIGANAIVSKSIPDNSIVIGDNVIISKSKNEMKVKMKNCFRGSPLS